LLSPVEEGFRRPDEPSRPILGTGSRGAFVGRLAVLGILLGFLPLASEASSTRDEKLFRRAETVLEEILSSPDQAIPQELLERAECVAVFPGLKKGAFFVGGQSGRGVVACRGRDGSLGPPAIFKAGGGSIGWQFGGQEADLVLLVMNPSGLEHLLRDRFTIGAEASAAAGPVGRTAKAATDAQLRAQILSWSRSRGAFLGASIEGTALWPDVSAIEEMYGKGTTAREVLLEGGRPVPPVARSWVAFLNKQMARRTRSASPSE